MSDNKLKTAADRKRINVHDHQELHYWSHRFGLATRFSAFGLLIMTGVIQLVVPEGWANFHLPWAALAGLPGSTTRKFTPVTPGWR